MRSITYRQKLRLKKGLKLFFLVIAITAVLLIAFVLFVGRYVVYTADGIRIDYSRNAANLTAQPQAKADAAETVGATITYESPLPSISEGGLLKGYYITTEQLQSLDTVRSAVSSLDYGATVMLEMKSIYGYFYYRTAIDGAQTAEADLDGIESLISMLRQRGCNLIAMVPAYSDYAFALANQSCGLSLSNGALWMNEDGCYWLNPASDTVSSYLVQIAKELSSKGFSEVVFEDFYFPSSSNIYYTSTQSRDELIASAAQQITSFFEGSNLIISFCTDRMDFPTKGLTGRLYLENVDAAELDRAVSAYASDTLDAATQLVFLTSSRDTRYDAHSTMQPLS